MQISLRCHGTGPAHCCYLNGKICHYLEEGTIPGRRWVCGLLRRYGSWNRMNQSDEYVPIGTYWESIGEPYNYCETSPVTNCCGAGN